ncbi:GIN domain-containing protein [Soonwooa sp.]|uniref:GIN domain-containing protein n=1 Tax=Soonwooa sp. TaxID=1938592 RepID=UPI0035B49D2C
MKTNKICAILLGLSLTLSACTYSKSNGETEFTIGGFNMGSNEGKGALTDKTYTFDFDEIKSSNALDVEVVKSSTEKIVVNAPSDIIDQIEVVQEGSAAVIRIARGVRNVSTNRVKVKVYAKDFNKLSASSSSTITVSDDFKSNGFLINASSSSTIKGTFDAPSINIQANSSADVVANIMSKDVIAQVSSSGTISLKGRSESINAQASSSGDVEAAEFTADSAMLQASSSGGIKIGVRNSVSGSASSSADIVVLKRGNLESKNVKESSSGSVTIK